jgi:hypothetical protein
MLKGVMHVAYLCVRACVRVEAAGSSGMLIEADFSQ